MYLCQVIFYFCKDRKDKIEIVIRLKHIIFCLIFPVLIVGQNNAFISEFGHFQKAYAFAVNETKSFFVLDTGLNEVIKLDSTGNIIKKMGGTGWDDYSFDNPVDICVTMLRVYITDRNNSRIQVFDKDLNFLFSLDSKNISPELGVFKYPISAQATSFGDLFLVDSDNKQIIKFKSNWTFSGKFGNNESGKFAIASPVKLAVDHNSNLFLLDGDKIITFDQFGNGIFTFKLQEKPNNISIRNNLLVVTYDQYILYSLIKENIRESFNFVKLKLNLEKRIIDALIIDDNVFVLLENSIQTFSRNLLENSN